MTECYLCLDCGNADKFVVDIDITLYGVRQYEMDGLGNRGREVYEDVNDDQENDAFNWECRECESDHVQNYSDEIKRLKVMWEHTNKQGRWYKDGLKEKSRSPTLLKQITMEEI